MRNRGIAALAVVLMVAGGLVGHLVFSRTGNAAAMWTAAILWWPAYLMSFAATVLVHHFEIDPFGSRGIRVFILLVAATIYYGAIATVFVLGNKRFLAVVVTAHATGTALLGWLMAIILDVGRTMEALQN